MNNDDFLTVRQTRELIDRLKTSVANFTKRESRVESGSRVNTSRLETETEEALEVEDKKLEKQLQQVEELHATKVVQVEQRFEQRKNRINQAYMNSRQRVREVIAAREGQGTYEMQKNRMMADRDRDAEFGKAWERVEALRTIVGDDHKDLVRLEKSAKRATRGYAAFRRMMARERKAPVAEISEDVEAMMEVYREEMNTASTELDEFKNFVMPRFFGALPISLLAILILLVHGAVAGLLFYNEVEILYVGAVGVSALWLLIIASFFYFAGKKNASESAAKLAKAMGRSRQLVDACSLDSDAHYQQQVALIEGAHADRIAELKRNYNAALQEAEAMKATYPKKIEDQNVRVTGKFENVREQKLAALNSELESALASHKAQAESTKQALIQSMQGGLSEVGSNYESNWEGLIAEWNAEMAEIYQTVAAANSASEKLFPPWDQDFIETWSSPTDFHNVANLGTVKVDVGELAGELPESPKLALPGPAELSIPLTLKIPEQASVLVESGNVGRDVGISTLNNVILRLMSLTPPGRLSFTVLDPVSLGENFAGIMHMADYEESLINSRIWTQPEHIDKRLGELNEHMEKVIQMYLRNDYSTITEYNEAAGNIAEKYHYLVVADFPNGFSDLAVKRLMSIAQSGARCGVYALIHWDTRNPAPNGFKPEDLQNSAARLTCKTESVIFTDDAIRGASIVPEAAPDPDYAINFIHKVGQASVDSTRVEVPFETIAPADDQFWSLETTKELKVPIGRTGATKLQQLAIGKGTQQHALVAGKTGSGKSTLFHVMITNLASWFSPDEVEFYLIDFKKGVEFKAYATHRLPHAKVIAIESDREFGLSVLQRVDDELKRRGDLFRQLGVQDIPGYKAAGGTEKMPRSLLLIDEFQEYFVEDDRVSQNAALLLDRIVRQGRAFGIHVILGSQTLGGAFTLARSTLGQMVIRIALQCNEADSYLIMDDSNPAARLLSRPGEGIYNDNAGAVEGNNPFQVVWLNDETREHYLSRVRKMADESGKKYAGPVVFEGNAPGNVRENSTLEQLLGADSVAPTSGLVRAYLGAPNSIKGPTEAAFRRQSGNNLLVVGQRDESALAILAVSMVSLSAQFAAGKLKFIIFDGTAPETPERAFLHRVCSGLGHHVQLAQNSDAEQVMADLSADQKARAEDESKAAEAPTTFVIIQGLQKFKKLRYEEDFSFSLDADAAPAPGAQLNDIITEGPAVGIHTIAMVDNYNNINRSMSRKALSEFEMRVLFQMSANDSSSLIDSTKASNLGLNRALFYNEQEGYLETFRPYALPDDSWIESSHQSLSKLLG